VNIVVRPILLNVKINGWEFGNETRHVGEDMNPILQHDIFQKETLRQLLR